MAKVSKTQIAIRVMKEHIGKPMSEVVPFLMKECDLSEKNARVCYTLRVKADPTLGTIETKTRAPKAARTPKGPKLIKVPKPKVQGNKPKVTDKTVEELEDIRKKNLARLKAVGAKYSKGQIAEPRFSDVPFDESAVPNFEAELDSFKAPRFLNKDQLKALV